MKNEMSMPRIIFAILGGGIFALASLFSLVAVVAVVGQEPFSILEAIIPIVALTIFPLLTIWAAGFWGRWGMILFFAVAPIAIVIDASTNPLFPVGVLLLAGVCYGASNVKHKNV